ncbi:MAG: NfeD family protein [Bacilli bacterium]|nr:NfeD family protein [Bacilli bacterium]
MFYFWLFIIIILAVIEIATINLVTVWFVASGLLAMFLTYIIDDFLIQMAVFVLGGIVLLITTKPLLAKWLKGSETKTNIDRIIGTSGIVTKDILINQKGEVKVDGKYWAAYAETEHDIKMGATVKVLQIDGAKIKVEEEL